MATSKSKGKLKKNFGRLVKMKLGNKETCETDTSDLSHLRKPIDTNLTSLKQVSELFEKGTDEVRDLLKYECDVIYECKICRNLFRSIGNLISHKRVYCLEKYGIKTRKYPVDSTYSIYYKNNNNATKSLVDYDITENFSNDRVLRSQSTRKEPKKDLTSVVDMLMKKQTNDSQPDDIYNENEKNCPLRITNDNEQVLLEMVDSNQAAYQTIITPQVSSNDDLMKTQTTELKNMANGGTVFLGPDGQFHESYPNIPLTQDEAQNENTDLDNSITNSNLTCNICNTKFSTKKTLTFHVKCKHTPHRVGFTCPCCSCTFTNRSSVYRHLYKVHRKSNDQVRKLRSQIQARAIRRDTIRFEKPSNPSESVHDQMREDTQNLITAQERMENLELDTDLHECLKCNKRFERKSALICHSQICVKRVHRDEHRGRVKRSSKIPPQRVEAIVDNTDKNSIDVPITSSNAPALDSSTFDTDDFKESIIQESPTPELAKEPMEIAIRVEDVSSLSKDVWDMIGNDNFETKAEAIDDESRLTVLPEQPELPIINDVISEIATSKPETSNVKQNPDVPEVIYTSIDNSRPVTLSVLETEKKLGIQYRGIRLPTVTLEKINFTGNRVYDKSTVPIVSLNLSSSKPKVPEKEIKPLPNTNNRKYQCVTCNRKFTSLLHLRRHLTVHQRRSRYRCKLCDYKACLKCDSIAHCNKKHNARNNRSILSELIIEIPINDVTTSVTYDSNNIGKKSNELEIIDINRNEQTSTNQPGIHEDVDLSVNIPPTLDEPQEQVKEKPRRGRPRKKQRAKKKNIPRKPRNVSPPSLPEDFHESHEISKINDSTIPTIQSPRKSNPPRNRTPRICCEPEPTIKASSKTVSSKNSDPKPRVRAPSRMSVDPEPRVRAPSRMSVDPEPRVRAPSRMSSDPEPRVRAPSRMRGDPEPRVRPPSRMSGDPEPRVRPPSRMSGDPEPRVRPPSRMSVDPEPQVRAPSRMSGDTRPRVRAPSRMDTDPELRKMVMEVIFGAAEKPVDESMEISENSEVSPKDSEEKHEIVILDNRETDRLLVPDKKALETEKTNTFGQNETVKINELHSSKLNVKDKTIDNEKTNTLEQYKNVLSIQLLNSKDPKIHSVKTNTLGQNETVKSIQLLNSKDPKIHSVKTNTLGQNETVKSLQLLKCKDPTIDTVKTNTLGRNEIVKSIQFLNCKDPTIDTAKTNTLGRNEIVKSMKLLNCKVSTIGTVNTLGRNETVKRIQLFKCNEKTIDSIKANIPKSIEPEKRGIIRIQSDQQVSLLKNNLYHNLNNVGYRKDFTIVQNPILITPKISGNNKIITSKTNDDQFNSTLASSASRTFIITSRQETDILKNVKK